MTRPRPRTFVSLRRVAGLLAPLAVLALLACSSAVHLQERDLLEAIAKRQRAVLGAESDYVPSDDAPPALRPTEESYDKTPGTPEGPLPAELTETGPAASAPAVLVGVDEAGELVEEPAPPSRYRDEPLTLTDALAYADAHRRELQSAKEDLYLAALSLTLERHLWTPQFAADVRTIYGNFGELEGFNQAMRFVSNLSVSQRLPYGGEFAARAVSTLIRDVGQTITAAEGTQYSLDLEIPFLAGAGHVAREQLIQLERELTYAVRQFERFRRQQLVQVASRYFALLQDKQAVFDAEQSLERARDDYERAKAFRESGREQGTVLDVGRALTRLLQVSNDLARGRESFRAGTDEFKILIGMPVDEQIGLDDLETISTVEEKIEAGGYPLLRPIVDLNEQAITEFAVENRLDVLNTRDRIEDQKRGVAIAENALLPDLNLVSGVDVSPNPADYNLSTFNFGRANWRSELILSMNDRFRERTQLRQAMIDVREAQRRYADATERVRADVKSAVNQISLQERLVAIALQTLDVADKQREYAAIQFEDGDIDNFEKVQAENDYVNAQNRLNAAKVARWNALLNFRLATETLRVDEGGHQLPPPIPVGP